jgi:acyl-CoA reductase-like NAD-dependent aldehyde dehydrogenase
MPRSTHDARRNIRPRLVANPWTDEYDVIRMGNNTHYGLAGYVWNHDIGRGLRAAHNSEADWVQVNQGLGDSLANHMAASSNQASAVSTR